MKATEALQKVIDGNANGHAKSYARAALRMSPRSETFRTQMLYVLFNIVYWRGDGHAEVREVIRKASIG